MASINCLVRAIQSMFFAESRALFSAGSNMAARIAMMAITMRSSIRVKNFLLHPEFFQLTE